MFLRYVWSFIIPGFGTTYITLFEDTEGAKTLAQNPVCTSNSKYIDARHPFLRELYFINRDWVFEQCNITPLRVLHISSCTAEGGCSPSCSVQSTSRSSFCGCLHFRIMRSLFFLVQLGPVLGTGISMGSEIIRKECFDFQTRGYTCHWVKFRQLCCFHWPILITKLSFLPGNDFWE